MPWTVFAGGVWRALHATHHQARHGCVHFEISKSVEQGQQALTQCMCFDLCQQCFNRCNMSIDITFVWLVVSFKRLNHKLKIYNLLGCGAVVEHAASDLAIVGSSTLLPLLSHFSGEGTAGAREIGHVYFLNMTEGGS